MLTTEKNIAAGTNEVGPGISTPSQIIPQCIFSTSFLLLSSRPIIMQQVEKETSNRISTTGS